MKRSPGFAAARELAAAAAEDIYIQDILDNSEMAIHLVRADADAELQSLMDDQ